jgi:hypothetical protein
LRSVVFRVLEVTTRSGHCTAVGVLVVIVAVRAAPDGQLTPPVDAVE